MAETKQYISQPLDDGCMLISEDVIGSIVAHAMNDVEGVAGVCGKPGADFAELIGMRNWAKGIKVLINEDNDLEIHCNIIVLYGYNVIDCAASVQNCITSAVEAIAGVTVTAVHVNVCEIQHQ